MIPLELICIGHINSRGEECKSCKIDEDNYHCPNYLSQKEAIRIYTPYSSQSNLNQQLH